MTLSGKYTGIGLVLGFDRDISVCIFSASGLEFNLILTDVGKNLI